MGALQQTTMLFSTTSLRELAKRSVYVGNLPWSTEEEQVRELFQPFGSVVRVAVPKDELGRTKGIAFVDMAETDDADKAIDQLHGYNFLGRDIRVSYSLNERRSMPRQTNGGSFPAFDRNQQWAGQARNDQSQEQDPQQQPTVRYGLFGEERANVEAHQESANRDFDAEGEGNDRKQ
ncbi:hypothetical protein H4R34_004230 [Dimargaris verticillata]|uniref:RRM domain-containing protein n=1 Tax=Dimargaris verticillata TaxID=2761393 RepID=A0A9W8B4Q5_9FUNG|nr:hypothetical protein H4R34_004230 [Dimargaris verticillata]